VTGNPVVVTEEIYPDTTYPGETLIFYDDFSKLNLKKWKHDLTLSGGGNWERMKKLGTKLFESVSLRYKPIISALSYVYDKKI